jgi:hypothetical protein
MGDIFHQSIYEQIYLAIACYLPSYIGDAVLVVGVRITPQSPISIIHKAIYIPLSQNLVQK